MSRFAQRDGQEAAAASDQESSNASQGGDETSETRASVEQERRRSSLPVSTDAVPRLFRRSTAYSLDNDRASVITISRATSLARDAFPDRAGSPARLRRSEEARQEAMEAGGHLGEETESTLSGASSPEEPLLASAHRLNHEHAPDQPETSMNRKISLAMNVSLVANALLLVVKIYAFWASKSKAILASAADSLVDIASQLVIAYAEYKVHKADPRFPIGRTRLETVGVVSCAVIMTLSTLEVVQTSVMDLWEGFHGSVFLGVTRPHGGIEKLLGLQLTDHRNIGHPPDIHIGITMYAILGGATGIKVLLYIFCFSLRKTSDSMMALAEDHCNDILSNLTAIICGAISSSVRRVWWVDPGGAVAISMYIIWSWGMICMNQVDKIVGKGAPEDFIEKLEELANSHHNDLEVDVIRAYFFGARFIVEMEVVMPAVMTVRESHDIALVLQHRVEGFDEVERAFVHVDYEKREEPEHKVERNLLRNSDNLFESYDSIKSRDLALEHQDSSKSSRSQKLSRHPSRSDSGEGTALLSSRISR